MFEGLRLNGALLVAALAMQPLGSNAASIVDANARMHTVDQAPTPFNDRVDAVQRLYDLHVGPALDDLGRLPASELASAFEVLDRVALYALLTAPDRMPHYLDRMQALVDALGARGMLTQTQLQTTFDTAIAMRQIDVATSLRERFPQFPLDGTIPKITKATDFDPIAPAVLEWQEGDTLLARNVDRSGVHFVTIVGCRASQRAIEELNALPEVVKSFESAPAFWLIPAERGTDPAFLREWNSRFPQQPAMFAYANGPWAGVEFHLMPHFQRFDGLKRVTRLQGWTRGGGAKQLEPVLTGREQPVQSLEPR